MLDNCSLRRRLACACTTLALATLWACQPTPPSVRPQSSSNLTLSPDGAMLAVTNPDLPTITFIDTHSLQVRVSVEVGDGPQTVSFTPDGRMAVVAVSRAGKVSVVEAASARVIGAMALPGQPYGVVTSDDRAYISLFALSQIAVIDLTSQSVVQRIDVEPFPTGLALTPGALLVTHFYSGRVTRISLSTLTPEKVIALHAEANLAQSIALGPEGAQAFLPQTLSHVQNLSLTAETTASPIVNVLNLTTDTPEPGPLLAGANLPLAAALSPDGRWLFIANGGTDNVTVVDLTTGQGVLSAPTGHHPRGLALAADGSRLFVNNALDGAVAVYDVEYANGEGAAMPRLSHRADISVGALPLSDEGLLGKRLFNSALPPMGAAEAAAPLSCATCHFDGGHDARTWLGFPDGPRNTPGLWNLPQTAPYHWSGDRPALQDVELTIRNIQHGAGFLSGEVIAGETAGRSKELDALAAYMASLAPPPSPFSVEAETLQRGEYAFARWGCAGCHIGHALTDQQLHDLKQDRIGDATLQHNPRGLAFDTPALIGVWASAPYFHDGSSVLLRETLYRAGFHGMGWAMDKQEAEDLVAYVLSR